MPIEKQHRKQKLIFEKRFDGAGLVPTHPLTPASNGANYSTSSSDIFSAHLSLSPPRVLLFACSLRLFFHRLLDWWQVVCPAGTLKKHARQLERGEIASLPLVDGAGSANTGAGAAQLAEELMSQLRRAHCALVRERGPSLFLFGFYVLMVVVELWKWNSHKPFSVRI